MEQKPPQGQPVSQPAPPPAGLPPAQAPAQPAPQPQKHVLIGAPAAAPAAPAPKAAPKLAKGGIGHAVLIGAAVILAAGAVVGAKGWAEWSRLERGVSRIEERYAGALSAELKRGPAGFPRARLILTRMAAQPGVLEVILLGPRGTVAWSKDPADMKQALADVLKRKPQTVSWKVMGRSVRQRRAAWSGDSALSARVLQVSLPLSSGGRRLGGVILRAEVPAVAALAASADDLLRPAAPAPKAAPARPR